MKQKKDKDEMRPQYDFSSGVRGKHHKKLKNGHKTIVTKADGSKLVRDTKLIALSPELQKYFPDSRSVNRALRGLVELLPERR